MTPLGLLTGNAEAKGLDHPARRKIYDHLLCLPGDHFRSIVRFLRLGHGTVRHHLAVLTRSGTLAVERSNGRVRYYPSGEGANKERNALFTKHWRYRDLRLRILFLARHAPVRPITVARRMGISRQLAGYHLAHLEELGLLKREGRLYRE